MQTVAFTGRERTKQVQVRADRETDEPDETVVLALSGPTGGAQLSQARGTGTIEDWCKAFPPLAWAEGTPGETTGERDGFGSLKVRLPGLDPETVCDTRNVRYLTRFLRATPSSHRPGRSASRLPIGPDPAAGVEETFSLGLEQGSPPPQSDTTFTITYTTHAYNARTGESTASHLVHVRYHVEGTG